MTEKIRNQQIQSANNQVGPGNEGDEDDKYDYVVAESLGLEGTQNPP